MLGVKVWVQCEEDKSKSWTKAQPNKLHCVYNKVWDGWTDEGMSKLITGKAF